MDPAGAEFRMTKDIVKSWAHDMQFPRGLKMSVLDYLDECKVLIRHT